MKIVRNIMKTSLKQQFLDLIIRTLEFILILIIVLDCNSVYRLRYGWDFEPQMLALWIANMSAYFLIALWIFKDRTNIQCIKDMTALIVISLICTTEYNSYLVGIGKGFLGYFFFFMTAMVILYRIHRKNGEPFRLLFLMEYVILFIAVASVLLWIGSSILELWGTNSDIKVFWGGIYYDANYLNLCIRRWVFAGDYTKNLGIFVEPPMFGLFLGFGLYTELYLKKKSNIAIVATFVIALISCRAILAIMLALLAFLFLAVELIWNKKYARIVIPVSGVLVGLGVVALFIYKMKTGWGSLATHIDDFAAALKCWTHYPIWGCGFDREAPIQEYMSDFRADNLGLSNSAAVVLAEGGIVLFAYYFIPFLLMMFTFFKKNRRFAYWAVGMFLFWVVVIFHTRLFIFFLMALGYSMIDFKLRLFNVKESEKRCDFKILYFSENISDDTGYFQKKALNMPAGLLIVMSVILLGASVYGLGNVGSFSIGNAIISIVLIIAVMTYGLLLLKKRNLNIMQKNIIPIGLWLIYMLVGQPYKVLDSFYTVTQLHLQDSWWKFVVVSVVFYSIGVLLDFFFDGRKRRNGETNI